MIDTKTSHAARSGDTPAAQFDRFQETLADRQPAWLANLRQSGMARFAELGFPTTQIEDWRFTNVAPIARLPFRPALEAVSQEPAREQIDGLTFGSIPGCRLVFVNGHFSPQLSRIQALPQGVIASSLAAQLAAGNEAVAEHLGRHVMIQDNAFAALNAAFFTDGGFIQVPPGTVVEEPIQLVYIASSRHAGTAIHPRNLIIAGAGSRLTVIESYFGNPGHASWTNAVTEVVAGEDAQLEHIKFQDEARDAFHLATIHGRFGRASNVTLHSFALGARLSRNNIRTHLAGEGLECILNGLYLTRGEQLADHHMVVEHAQPHCASHEYFNGILDDKSKGVFHGRILVQPVAQKTDAKQTNKNILLSDEATADAKPQLEIYADDVKCTHGATVGQLNEDSIFYLRARGIGLEKARRMLIHSFAGEIIERVRHAPARAELDRLVWDRLEQNPHIADND